MSRKPQWYTMLLKPQSAGVLACLAIVAFIFTSVMTYTQWSQIVFQKGQIKYAVQGEPRSFSQIQREVLRLQVVIEKEGGIEQPIDAKIFDLQRDLVASRINVIQHDNSFRNSHPSNDKGIQIVHEQWDALQPLLDQWDETASSELYNQVTVKLIEFEKKLNAMVTNEAHVSVEIISDFNQSLEKNIIYLFLGVTGFLFFLSAFFIGLLLSARQLKVSQVALVASEEQLRTTLDMIPDTVARMTHNGIFTAFYPSATFGLPLPDENTVVGRSLEELMPKFVSEKLSHAIQAALDEGVEQVFESAIKKTAYNAAHILEIRVVPISEFEVQGMMRDVTSERRKEEALLQSQKLESLGLLAGGIAHDFNNILAGIMGQASLAKMREDRGLPSTKSIGKIISATEKAADLTRQLLAYAGKGQFLVEALDVNTLIKSNQALLETVSLQGVELIFDLANMDIPIKADKGQIQQILLNLVINAGDAIGSDGGRITLRTGTELIKSAGERDIWSSESSFKAGYYAFFEVEDNGSGMSPDILSKIFDPFFTTKATGHGLGLSGTLGTVHRLHGGVRVTSIEGIGSQFTMLFPLLEEVAVDAPQKLIDHAHTWEQKHTILIVDDKAEIRDVLISVLDGVGLDVLAAANGGEALSMFEANQTEIDLLILDMLMPDINGDQVYCRIREMSSSIPVIVSSGYSESSTLESFECEPFVSFLQKPYHVDDLLNKVHRILSDVEDGAKADKPCSQHAKNVVGDCSQQKKVESHGMDVEKFNPAISPLNKRTLSQSF